MPETANVCTDARAVIAQRLTDVFARIQAERMDGVPILNPRLEVEVLGVREWNGHWLALLVTPWFINLLLLPSAPEPEQAWRALAPGASATHRFPAGPFGFIVGEEEGLGRYQMCSLFSPVIEFQDQAAARIAGRAALEALFDASLDEERVKKGAVAASGISRRGLLKGKIASQGGSA